MRTRGPAAAVALAIAVVAIAACGDDENGDPTATVPSATEAPVTATAAPDTPPVITPTDSDGTAPASVEPCTLRDALDGRVLTPGPDFELNDDVAWQLCIGGGAAGSSEKYLFTTDDGGASWTLISQTTLGNPPQEPSVGELPNGNAAEALFFVAAETGWLGLSSPGPNLYRSNDGGMNWVAVDALPSGLPVLDIEFSDAQNGTLMTPDGTWTTSNGGETWTEAP